MVTSSCVVPQGPLLTVQRSVTLPVTRPVTAVVALFALAIVAVPLTTVQMPCAGAATALAAITVEPAPQRLWSAPASAAATAGSKSVTRTSSVVALPGQGPLEVDHR